MPEFRLGNPLYPDVPQVPGVPPLASDVPTAAEDMASADSAQVADTSLHEWGVYFHGELVLEPDSINTLDVSIEYRIADYPTEEGEFRSYNKVATPKTVRLAMSKGGSLADRETFAKSITHILPNLLVYDVVTPEEVYTGMNIVHVGQARSSDRGAGMITVDIEFQEVRQTGDVQYSDTDTGGLTTASNALASSASPASAQPVKKAPTVRTPKSPASARRISRGSIQPKGPSKESIARLRASGFVEQPNGDFVLKL